MKKIFLLLCAISITQLIIAEDYNDALRFANFDFSGTARSSAMGGAFGSLGGDLSVTSNNPAGLAIYRISSASITPGMHFSKNEANGVTGDSNKFILPSVGFVFTTTDDSSNIKNWNFGVTYTQGANYNSKSNLIDPQSTYYNSFINNILYEAEINEKGLLPTLAWYTYLINKDAQGYYSKINETDILRRVSDIKDKGSAGEVAFSIAGNLDHILYFGATLGLQSIDYDHYDNYSEKIINDNSTSILDQYFYDTESHTKGSGINLKVGAIFRPIDPLRVSLAIHTPTYYNMEQEYTRLMETHFLQEPEKGKGLKFLATDPANDKIGTYDYSYQTPWKFSFGGSYIFGKTGLLSIDYDLIDYSSAKFSDGDYSVTNQIIKDTYKLTGNLKVGAEVRLTDQFSLRGGYNYFGNMYEKNTGLEQKASQYSGGIGYTYQNIFIDASYQHYTQENITRFDDSSSDILDYKVNTVKLTLGYKF